MKAAALTKHSVHKAKTERRLSKNSVTSVLPSVGISLIEACRQEAVKCRDRKKVVAEKEDRRCCWANEKLTAVGSDAGKCNVIGSCDDRDCYVLRDA